MPNLKQGNSAPAFTSINQDEKNVSLSDFKGKWLVLYFYPKDNTPGCSIEGMDFSALKDEFDKLNAVVIGVSADSVASHCKFIEKRKLTIDLLADEDKDILTSYGVWGKKKFMGREFMGIIRSTFLIDPKGKIAHIWSPVKVKGHAKDVLETLKNYNSSQI